MKSKALIYSKNEQTPIKNLSPQPSILSLMFSYVLTISGKFIHKIGVQWDQLSQEEYAGINSYNIRNIRETNKYWKNGVQTYLIPEGGMLKTTNSTTLTTHMENPRGGYKNTFGDIHDIQIMAGSEIRKNWVDNQASTGYGYDPQETNIPESHI